MVRFVCNWQLVNLRLDMLIPALAVANTYMISSRKAPALEAALPGADHDEAHLR